MLITNLILFFLACLVLVFSGTMLVKTLTKIAIYLRLSEFVIGFILMGLATSMPELFVGVSSALAGNGAFGLGNVIGSNILNITLIGGIIVLLGGGIRIESKKTKKDALYMFFIALLPVILMWIGHSLSRIDAFLLLGAFLLYTKKLLRERKEFTKEPKEREKRWEPIINTFLFVISIVLLFFSSKYIITYASLLSIDLSLPPILIGLFLISVGTTLPELVFESRAVQMNHSEMALGNLMGSVIVRSTLVLCTTALISPITAHFSLFLSSGFFMVVVAFIFATFVESGNRLYFKEGISLIMLYVFFVILEFIIKGV